MDSVQFCLLFTVVIGISSTSNNIAISPQSVNVTEGSVASFYCRVEGAESIIWHLNGTLTSQLPETLKNQSIITTGVESYSDNMTISYFRTVAQPVMNNSRIQCIGILASNNRTHSEPALLLIQGELQVNNLTVEIAAVNSLLIQWMAPFSLIITPNIEVTYCVDVYNSTDQTLETSICGLNETQYRYEAMSDPSPCDGVDIYVIPVNGVENGSRSHIIGTFYNEPDYLMSSELGHSVMHISEDEISIGFNVSDLIMNACYCSACISPLNGELSTKACFNASCDDNQISLCINSNSLEWNREYSMIITLHNNAGTAASDTVKLSTYDVQNITIHTTMEPGRVEVDVHFLRSSLARGCLLILSQAQYTGYFAIKKESGREVQNTHIENLPKGEYTIRGYDIESDGLPNHPTPAVIHNFTLSRGSTSWNQTRARIFTASASNIICINDTLAMGYAYMVLHPVNDLSNITVKNVNFTSQQDYYCFHAGVFSVAVFEWKNGFFSFRPTTVIKISTFNQSSTVEHSTRNEPSSITIAAVGVGSGAAVIIMAIILGVTITIKCKSSPKIHTTLSSEKTPELRSTIATEPAVEYPFHSTLDMTDPQYEDIDLITNNSVRQNESSMPREQSQEFDYNDPHYSTVESHATPYASVQENACTQSYKDDFVYSTVQKQSTTTRKKLHKTESQENVSVQENTQTCVPEHEDDFHVYSAVHKQSMKLHKTETPVYASVQKERDTCSYDASHIYSMVNKKFKVKSDPEMDDHLYAQVNKTKSKISPINFEMSEIHEMKDHCNEVDNKEEVSEIYHHPTSPENNGHNTITSTTGNSDSANFEQDDDTPEIPPFNLTHYRDHS